MAVVSAPAAVQRARVLQRPGMSPEKLDAILARQVGRTGGGGYGGVHARSCESMAPDFRLPISCRKGAY